VASEKITQGIEKFSDWYKQLMIAAELADYALVQGCMRVRSYGWALWENLPATFDLRINATGHVNAAFPLFIPLSFLEREKGPGSELG
jgi:prolyl-tRNA synthetase